MNINNGVFYINVMNNLNQLNYMENLTLDLVKGIQNIKEETYKVKS